MAAPVPSFFSQLRTSYVSRARWRRSWPALRLPLRSVTNPDSNLLQKVRAWCAERGLNLLGVADAERFDRAQCAGRRARDLAPTCGSILLLGSGGRSHWDWLQRVVPDQLLRPVPGVDPIDGQSRAVADDLLGWLAEFGIAGRVVGPNDPDTLNFVQLGEAAGLGTISPVIHQLLHPEYGPWVSLRAALLLDGRPLGSPDPEVSTAFQPCECCPRPCVAACPVSAYGEPPGLTPTCTPCGPQLQRCADNRLAGDCADGCDVRRSCPVGGEHRYSPAEEAYRHGHGLLMIRAASQSHGWWSRFSRLFGRR